MTRLDESGGKNWLNNWTFQRPRFTNGHVAPIGHPTFFIRALRRSVPTSG
jgi:hypothetical protein